MPDEIDRIVAKIIHETEGWETPWQTCTQCEFRAHTIRAALLAAGYVIQLDEAALLKKGEEAGITLK